jgi:hypothetical protein
MNIALLKIRLDCSTAPVQRTADCFTVWDVGSKAASFQIHSLQLAPERLLL